MHKDVRPSVSWRSAQQGASSAARAEPTCSLVECREQISDPPDASGPGLWGGVLLSERPDFVVPDRFNLGQLRKQAKDLKSALRAGDRHAIDRVVAAHPKYRGRASDRVVPDRMTLRDAQATLASEIGFDSWAELIAAVDKGQGRSLPRWPVDADRNFFGRTLKQSQLFEHGVIGPDEVFLALLQPRQRTAVVEVLEECGFAYDEVRDWLSRRSPRSPWSKPERREYITNPAWSGCIGMAKGLALAAGSAQVRDEDALVALLYQGWLEHHLERVDLTAPELVARLAAKGVAIPPLLPSEPEPPRGPMGPRVYFPCEEPGVTRGLRDAIQFRAWWGFNRDEAGRCYVDGEEDADLPNLVRSLVADPATVEVVPLEQIMRSRGKSAPEDGR